MGVAVAVKTSLGHSRQAWGSSFLGAFCSKLVVWFFCDSPDSRCGGGGAEQGEGSLRRNTVEYADVYTNMASMLEGAEIALMAETGYPKASRALWKNKTAHDTKPSWGRSC